MVVCMPTTVAGGGRKCHDFCGRWGFDEAQPARDSGRLLPEIASKITHGNLTRVLQRLGVVEDQARAGLDLGLRNRLFMDVKIAGVHDVLAVPSVYRGRNGYDPPSNEKPYSATLVGLAEQSATSVGHLARGTRSAGSPQGQSGDWARG